MPAAWRRKVQPDQYQQPGYPGLANGLGLYQPREPIQCPVREHRRIPVEPTGRPGPLCQPERRFQDLFFRVVKPAWRSEGLFARAGTIGSAGIDQPESTSRNRPAGIDQPVWENPPQPYLA